jgi:hypothetical protein
LLSGAEDAFNFPWSEPWAKDGSVKLNVPLFWHWTEDEEADADESGGEEDEDVAGPGAEGGGVGTATHAAATQTVHASGHWFTHDGDSDGNCVEIEAVKVQ